jgi:hypothetical protein
MPHGFFTIEQWQRSGSDARPQWVPVSHVNAGKTLAEVVRTVEAQGTPGFYRVVQTQRMIWAEVVDGKLQLRKWHAGSPETLLRSAEAFDRDGGKWPIPARRRKKKQP